MRNGFGMLAAAALLALPLGAAAQAGSGREVSIERTHAQTITATVQSIDLKTRMVTLKGEDGKLSTFHADEQVKNLPQVKVGDLVHVDYFESIAVYVAKPDPAGGGSYAQDKTSVATAKPGEKPGAMATREVTLVATVAAIADDKSSVTLKNENGTKVIPVKNPDNLTGVKVGDEVTIITEQALAVSVEKAPQKAKEDASAKKKKK
jgi:Cu/Ag efflux protein CusF